MNSILIRLAYMKFLAELFENLLPRPNILTKIFVGWNSPEHSDNYVMLDFLVCEHMLALSYSEKNYLRESRLHL